MFIKSIVICARRASGNPQFMPTMILIRGGRSQFFRLRLRSCSKLFESRSGSGNFSHLRIWLLFRPRLQSSIQPYLTHVFT